MSGKWVERDKRQREMDRRRESEVKQPRERSNNKAATKTGELMDD
jgi:hypothetical protein